MKSLEKFSVLISASRGVLDLSDSKANSLWVKDRFGGSKDSSNECKQRLIEFKQPFIECKQGFIGFKQ